MSTDVPLPADFERAFAITVEIEGGLSLDPNDKGNWTGGQVGRGVLKGTKYGVSAAAYPDLDIAHVTIPQAKVIALTDYWDRARCSVLRWPLNAAVFDMAYHSGPGAARMTLQTAVGVAPDGVFGPITMRAINAHAPIEALVKFQAERLVFMSDAGNWRFYRRGWGRRLFGLTLELTHG